MRAQTATPRWCGASEKNVAVVGDDLVDSTDSPAFCKHCGTPTTTSSCPTCRSWLRVNAAHVAMSAALREVANGR